MAQRIIGLDLGTASVKVVRVEPKGKGGFSVEAYGEVALAPLVEGETPRPIEDRWSDALAELKQKGLLDGDTFVTGLPGEQAAVRTLKFPFSDAKKIGESLPFALESEIAHDLDEIVFSWVILGGTKRKDGPNETEVLVAFAKKDAVQKHLDLLAVHGIDPRHVEFDALALDDLFDSVLKSAHETEEGPRFTAGGTMIELGGDAPDPAIAMVDIGHRRTSVCVLADGRVVSAHTILHGGADATRALAREIGLPLEEAERGKRKEAFIEVLGAKAQFPEQQQISEALKSAYAPIVRRLRQIFQAAVSSSNRVRVVKVFLTGGGSRVLNLDRHLAEQLNVKVVHAREMSNVMRGAVPMTMQDGGSIDGAPEAALALSYALSGLAGSKTRARIDFRTQDFAWKGDFDFLRERATSIGAWAAVLLLLLAGNGVARAAALSTEEDALIAKQVAACKEITGQEIDSTARCLAIIQERINGQASFRVPEHSSVDTYLEISKRIPPAEALKRKVTEMDIAPERARLKGTTTSYDAIDKIVEGLAGGPCFANIEKGKARNVSPDVVEFNATIQLDCAAAPGEPEKGVPGAGPTAGAVDRPPPTPRGRAAASATASDEVTAPLAEMPAKPAMPTMGAVSDDPATEAMAPSEGRGAGSPYALTPAERAERRERLRKLREQGNGEGAVPRSGPQIGPQIGPQGTPLAPRGGALRERLRSRPAPGATLPDGEPIDPAKSEE